MKIPECKVCVPVVRYAHHIKKVERNDVVYLLQHNLKKERSPMLPFNPDTLDSRLEVPDEVAERIATIITLFPDNLWVVPHPVINKVEYYLGLEPTKNYRLNPSRLCNTGIDTLQRTPTLLKGVVNGSAKNMAQREILWAKYHDIQSRETLLDAGESLGIVMPPSETHTYHNTQHSWKYKGIVIEPNIYEIPEYTPRYILADYIILWTEIKSILRKNGNSALEPEQLYNKFVKLVGGSKELWSRVLRRKRTQYAINRTEFAAMWRVENVIFTTFEIAGITETGKTRYVK